MIILPRCRILRKKMKFFNFVVISILSLQFWNLRLRQTRERRIVDV